MAMAMEVWTREQTIKSWRNCVDEKDRRPYSFL